ncbi:hypothetical protein ACFOWE_24815 [Planomonospora corallina]|uniref:Uncharacterized protein n=1 Tax=Planomonospora corallina TaxID=1806052 RepID=A0ABV8IC49_9ACTN
MTSEISEGTAAARALAARLPGWTVWYGEHTRRFWALSRTRRPAGASHAEAGTAEELERAVRLIEDGAAPASPSAPAREAPAPAREAPAPEAPRHGPAEAERDQRRAPARTAG